LCIITFLRIFVEIYLIRLTPKIYIIDNFNQNMKINLLTLVMASMMLCPMGAEAQETKEMKYPQAEWTKAGDILMLG
jgi:hypothetical protein